MKIWPYQCYNCDMTVTLGGTVYALSIARSTFTNQSILTLLISFYLIMKYVFCIYYMTIIYALMVLLVMLVTTIL